ncbi:flagellar motor switch protein FliN [Dasania marina]|uniref:flagellar motor switch protein FliN n=1 Tax=Dasania marina TaxID=471499 RepID=UPI00037F583A|nr:flagellar motor switch protein FliN [Dasania marina]|tara:strand:+ start:4189 stop:4641 length:453 start_codon:yes stop_codon:yes gene_type:complete
MSDDEDVNQEDMADDWAAAMSEQGVEADQDDIDALLSGAQDDSPPAAEPAPMEELTDTSVASGEAPDLDVILDIPVRISMEVGNTQISIRNLLQLNQGSVIEMDRLAGEPLDVLVNGTLIAHGEVVVVNEKFGIRMTDVISPSERIKKLR